jgi:hypothetical protein
MQWLRTVFWNCNNAELEDSRKYIFLVFGTSAGTKYAKRVESDAGRDRARRKKCVKKREQEVGTYRKGMKEI